MQAASVHRLVHAHFKLGRRENCRLGLATKIGKRKESRRDSRVAGNVGGGGGTDNFGRSTRLACPPILARGPVFCSLVCPLGKWLNKLPSALKRTCEVCGTCYFTFKSTCELTFFSV